MASVASRCPACGVHSSGVVVRGPAVRPSGVRPVRCPVTRVRRPGSGGPTVCCPPVQRPASGVQPSGVQPAGVRPRPDASVSSHTGQWRWDQAGAAGQPTPRERVEVPMGGRVVERLGRRPQQDRTRATPPGSRMVGGLSVADPGRVRAAAALDAGLPGQAKPACGAPMASGGARAREQAAARGCAPAAALGWVRDHGAWLSWRLPPGWAGPEGRWACRRGWAFGPSAAQAASERSRLAADSALTRGDGWWACQDLNLGSHPYQLSRAQRCADRPFPRSPPSVRGEVMRS
jgi:hypothetical protein